MEPKGSEKEAKREPKGSQRAPKVSQRVPKGSQGEPKGNQRQPKGSQKWAKGRPKCIRKSTFGKGREKVSKMAYRRRVFGSHFELIFHNKSMNKSMRKSMPKKGWILMKNRCENEAIVWYVSKNVFMKKRLFRKSGECCWPIKTICFFDDFMVLQKKEKSEKWEKSWKNTSKKRCNIH